MTLYSSNFFTNPHVEREVLVWNWAVTDNDDMLNLTNVPGITNEISEVLNDNDIESLTQLIGMALVIHPDLIDGDLGIEEFMDKLLDMGIVDDSGLITQSIWSIIAQNLNHRDYDRDEEEFITKGQELFERQRQRQYEHNFAIATVVSRMREQNIHMGETLYDYVPIPHR